MRPAAVWMAADPAATRPRPSVHHCVPIYSPLGASEHVAWLGSPSFCDLSFSCVWSPKGMVSILGYRPQPLGFCGLP